ncbi:aromatic ring-hydroxylating oxygenase subunit alpha [Pseudanabaena sp. PCC 6802]|uniref:aromatic ring-hydroxylating dioxygenase subunit alpha n=1 Tax=Pseudanabaena sp. PCC 6802 TaxID=118173 RepID=UPI00034CC3A6|nr:aromatic ring-hydroxylating dioxygenase subunit alpha [Pseudanabaena sp. PCC 6802]
MLKNFWYACEFSSAITSKPKQIKLLNQEFVLYRNSQGQIIAFKDRCPHRGAALSQGWSDRDCIRCPYHGWKFQADGACIEIPSNEDGELIPHKARLDAYPAQEKYGFVWLFWGDLPESECRPLPSFPEINKSTYRLVQTELTSTAHYTRLLENHIDAIHPAFVHPTAFGSGLADNPRFSKFDLQMQDWGATASFYNKKYLPKGFLWTYISKLIPSEIKITIAFHLPNIVCVDIDEGKLVVYLIPVPHDDNTATTKSILCRQFLTSAWADGIFRKLVLKAHQEDGQIVESQHPKVMPHDLEEEVHVSSDALSIAYRELLKKAIDMGWGIERKSRDAFNFAVRSPNWEKSKLSEVQK